MEKNIYEEKIECPRCGDRRTIFWPRDKDYICKCNRYGNWLPMPFKERPLFWWWMPPECEEEGDINCEG